ncbi:C40 family peptidase [Romboutsia lituseburensis]|uniref:C40 family peptidase n=1 Tax=Romboutsia lituseburensis TaxID=1537 RepID=UPI00215B1C15|nr:C40 family peptidase [Romboutsia lituseburensis]MCR8745850.1 C40 family peptidase [Romboutsia lituseburensis]
MSDVGQIVANSLLSNINRTNLRNANNSNYGDSNAASFDRMLQSSLNNLMGGSTNSGCSCGGGNNDLSQLLMLTTMVSVLNSVKAGVSQGNDNNNVGNTADSTNSSNTNDTNNTNTVNNGNTINNTNTVTNVNNSSATSSEMDKAMKLLEDQIGKPYVWGANGPNSFDCSGLVRYVYKNALGKDIPRVSYDQSKFGQAVDKKDLKPGDLVFFDTMNKDRVSHVGMYIGNDEFIHASNPKDGVKKSKLSSSYYQNAYMGARRP